MKIENLIHIWNAVSFKRRIVWVGSLAGLLILTSSSYFLANITSQKDLELKVREIAEKPQNDELFSYAMTIISSKENLKTNRTSKLQIEPKLILINLKNGVNDPNKLIESFDENFIAKNKDELKTIIEVARRTEAKGRYSDGSHGFTYIYNITIIDVAQQTIILTNEIRGSEPPQTKSGREVATGSDPIDKVKSYLNSIPIIGK